MEPTGLLGKSQSEWLLDGAIYYVHRYVHTYVLKRARQSVSAQQIFARRQCRVPT